MFSGLDKSLLRWVLVAVAICLLGSLSGDSAVAQCVMCRASLTGNGAFARSLNLGTLVLLLPPVSIFCAIFILAIRNRKSD